MKRTVLFSVASVAAAVGLTAGVATTALLMDADDNAGNQIEAGTVGLFGSSGFANGSTSCATANLAEDDWSATFTVPAFDTMKPGDGTRKTAVCMANLGSIDGSVNLVGHSIVDLENECVDPESEAGDDSCGPSDGELSHQLRFGISTYSPVAGVCPAPPGFGQARSFTDLQTGVDLGALDAHDAQCVGFTVQWPEDPSATGLLDRNRANGDGVRFDLRWTLTQVP